MGNDDKNAPTNGGGNNWGRERDLVLYKVRMLERRMESMDKRLWGVVIGILIVLVKVVADLGRGL